MAFQTKTLSVKFDANGTGELLVQNNNSAVQWVIGQLSVLTSPTSPGAQCVITPPIGIIDTSYFAGTGDTANGVWVLSESDFIRCSFTSGPANGTGIVTIVYIEVPI